MIYVLVAMVRYAVLMFDVNIALIGQCSYGIHT